MIDLYVVLASSIILEVLPVSSSSHIYLIKSLFNRLGYSSLDATMLESINFFSHGPTVFILLFLFFPYVKLFLYKHKYIIPILLKLCCYGFIIELITVLGYCILHGKPITTLYLAFGFFITTLFLFSLYFCKQKNGTLTLKKSIIIGIAQAIAFFPGISRFGSTFTAARWCGFENQKAFKLSFFIELPISIAAACKGSWMVYKTVPDVLNLTTICIMLTSSIVACYVVIVIFRIITHNKLWLVSGYTFLLALVLAIKDSSNARAIISNLQQTFVKHYFLSDSYRRA